MKRLIKGVLCFLCWALIVFVIFYVVSKPNYLINIIEDDYVSKQVITIIPKKDVIIDHFDVYKNGDLLCSGNIDNDFCVNVSENEKYKIVVTEGDGRVYKESIAISNIDNEPPTIDVSRDGDNYHIALSDNGCGINYDGIKVINEKGNVIPLLLEDSTISFTSNDSKIIISVFDNNNNMRRTTIYK